MCKDSNNVDSEIHYFKDGSIPLFCSVDFFGCLQSDITVHHILSNFMMLLWYSYACIVVLHFINSFLSLLSISLTMHVLLCCHHAVIALLVQFSCSLVVQLFSACSVHLLFSELLCRYDSIITSSSSSHFSLNHHTLSNYLELCSE